MPFGPLQVQNPSGGLLQQIISKQAGQGNTLLFNSDSNNTVYLCSKPSTNVQGLEESSPLAPLSSLIVDGTEDVYAYTSVNGQTATVMRFPSASAFQPGTLQVQGNVNATVAGNVNVTNSPNVNITGQTVSLDVSAATVNINPAAGYVLPGNKANLYTLPSAQSVAASASFTATTNQDIRNYSACDLSVLVTCASQGTVGAPLTSQLTLQWFDDATGTNLIFEEDWFVYVASGVITGRAFGSFPMRGQYMTVKVTNTSSAVGVTVQALTVTGTYRNPVYSSFRQIPPPMTVSGVTLANLGTLVFSNNLGFINNQTPGAGVRLYLLPLYAGPVVYFWQIATAALTNAPTLVDLSFATSGNVVPGTSQAGFMRALSNVINTPDSQTVMFPRSPVGVIVNPAATSQLQFSAIGQQGY